MIEIIPIDGIAEISKGDDIGAILSTALADMALKSNDFIVITQKIISKAEGQMVALVDIIPSTQAQEIADTIGKDPRLVELVLSESTDIIRAQRGVLITRHRLGLVMANAGIDCSNLGPDGEDHALLLPKDPDASAQHIANSVFDHLGVRPAVIISDSFGRPWRHGVVNVAVGASGLPALYDKRGEVDRNGRTLQSTLIANGDLIASAAGLVMGEAAEGIPVAVIKGLVLPGAHVPASALIRPLEEDMFQ